VDRITRAEWPDTVRDRRPLNVSSEPSIVRCAMCSSGSLAEPHDPGLTRSLSRGLALLEAIAQEPHGLTSTRLAVLVDIDKATTIRLLRTLTMCGYVRQDGQKRYSLTARLLRLAHRSLEETPLAEVARPFLSALRDQTAETVHLGILEHDRVVYIEKLDSPQTIQLFSRLGSSMPVNTTALGKAICASLSLNRLNELLALVGLEARTPRSITNLDRLRDELRATEARGYAIDDRENEPGVICVGAAIADMHGALAEPAAISISGPDFRMQSRLAELGALCRQTADRVSRALGLSEADYHDAHAQLRPAEETSDGIGATNFTPTGDAEDRASM